MILEEASRDMVQDGEGWVYEDIILSQEPDYVIFSVDSSEEGFPNVNPQKLSQGEGLGWQSPSGTTRFEMGAYLEGNTVTYGYTDPDAEFTPTITVKACVGEVLVDYVSLENIANAIREKNGKWERYLPSEMASAIAALDDVLIERTATEITSNVAAIAANVFYKYDTLISANFPNAKSVGSYAFYNCYDISTISLPLAETIGGYAFGSCNELTSICLPSCKTMGQRAFYSCKYLTTVDLPSIESIDTYAFIYCYNLKTVIMRGGTVCEVGSSSFNSCYRFSGEVNEDYNPDGIKDGYFYVPSALVEAYKTASDWLYYADCFRALEDYTVDGTITGALDESKI